MNKQSLTATIFAVMAAVFYAFNVLFSKILLLHTEPALIAGLLYLGAGVGIGVLSLFLLNNRKKTEHLTKKDLPYVIGMIVLDIAAPIFLKFEIIFCHKKRPPKIRFLV